jgi:hypothetical protein
MNEEDKDHGEEGGAQREEDRRFPHVVEPFQVALRDLIDFEYSFSLMIRHELLRIGLTGERDELVGLPRHGRSIPALIAFVSWYVSS